jgi:hypothetical protein
VVVVACSERRYNVRPQRGLRYAVRAGPGSLTTEQCVDRALQSGRSRLTGACRESQPTGRPKPASVTRIIRPTTSVEGTMFVQANGHAHRGPRSSYDRILLRDEKTPGSHESANTGSFSSKNFDGEFDPGSGRTLAVRLMHASRGRTTRSVR